MYECPTTQPTGMKALCNALAFQCWVRAMWGENDLPKSDAAHQTSFGLTPYSMRNEYHRLTKWLPVGRWIPFGWLVVPDVYSKYRGSFASTGTHSHGSLCANNVSHSTKFLDGGNGDVRTFVRWKITLQTGFHSDNVSASFKMSKYRMTLFGSTPQLAAMTTFGSACSIRVHSSLAAKPNKTILFKNVYI